MGPSSVPSLRTSFVFPVWLPASSPALWGSPTYLELEQYRELPTYLCGSLDQNRMASELASSRRRPALRELQAEQRSERRPVECQIKVALRFQTESPHACQIECQKKCQKTWQRECQRGVIDSQQFWHTPIPDTTPDRMLVTINDRFWDGLPERFPGKMSDKILKNVWGRMSEHAPEI